MSVALVGTACLMPLAALLSGHWASGDVLLSYLFELYAVLFWTLVRVATAPGPLLARGTVSTNGGPPCDEPVGAGPGELAGGLRPRRPHRRPERRGVHIAGSAGLRAGPWALAGMAAGFFACHGFDVALRWVVLGDRHRASTSRPTR